MKVLSLFDGISCGMVALKRAGIEVNEYYAAEIDLNAITISKKNYPEIIRLGDVKNIKGSDLPKIDLIIGGSPCQGFSRAGKCLNFNDPRSALFFEYVRILNELKQINPNVKFLLENVTMKKEWMDVITEYLQVKPIAINSKIVSAQNRERLYWTNIKFSEFKDKGINLENILDQVDVYKFDQVDGIRWDSSFNQAQRGLVNVVDGEVRIRQATKKGYIVPNDYDGVSLDFPTSKTRRGRVIRQKANCVTCAGGGAVFYNNTFRKLTVNECEKLQTLPHDYTEGVFDAARIKAIGNGWTVDVIAHIFRGLKDEGYQG